MCMNGWSIASGTIRAYGFGGGGVTLSYKVCLCGGECGALIYTQAMPSDTVHFVLSVDQDLNLLALSPAPYLPVPIKCFLL